MCGVRRACRDMRMRRWWSRYRMVAERMTVERMAARTERVLCVYALDMLAVSIG